MARKAATTPSFGGPIFGDQRKFEAEVKQGSAMTVERAILLVVGAIVLGSVLLSVYHSAAWLWLTGIMAAHLIQASFTGLCPVVATLKKLGLPTKAGFG